MIEKQRKVEKGDWPLIRAILSENYSEKETKRKVSHFQKLDRLKDSCVIVGVIDFNLISVCVQENNKTEKFSTKAWPSKK